MEVVVKLYHGEQMIAWEVTTDTNFGVDLGLLNNRIKFSKIFHKELQMI